MQQTDEQDANQLDEVVVPPVNASVDESNSASAPQSGASKNSVLVGQLAPLPRELGGREGPDPTRFGDWERAGRCIDF